MRSVGGLSEGSSLGNAWGKVLRAESRRSLASDESLSSSVGEAGLTMQMNV